MFIILSVICRIYGKALNSLSQKPKLVWTLVSAFSFPIFNLVRDYRVYKMLFLLQGSTGVRFQDVAGIDEAVEELQEVISFEVYSKIMLI